MSGDTCPHYTRYEVSKESSRFVDPRNQRTNYTHPVQRLVPQLCVSFPYLLTSTQRYASSRYQNVTRSYNIILAHGGGGGGGRANSPPPPAHTRGPGADTFSFFVFGSMPM